VLDDDLGTSARCRTRVDRDDTASGATLQRGSQRINTWDNSVDIKNAGGEELSEKDRPGWPLRGGRGGGGEYRSFPVKKETRLVTLKRERQ
jgi:hypothetical protein